MSRLLITGDTGLLGSAVVRHALREHAVYGISRVSNEGSHGWAHAPVDLLDESTTSRLFEEVRPHVIVHCAAATDVEQCEQDPRAARALNAGATGRLAAWAAQTGTQFVYVSTDSVFDGTRGRYREEDPPNPLNAYGRSKAAGERVTLERHPDALILRTNFFGWNRGAKPNIGRWAVGRLMRGEPLGAFADVRFSPLFVEDLAKLVLDLAARNAKGIFHVAASDSCTKHEFACRLGHALRLNTSNVKPILLEDASFRAKRPRDTSLDAAKCAKFLGRGVPSVQQGIAAFAKTLSMNSGMQSENNSRVEGPIALSAR